ncbi:MAG: B12-binding domain-containing radical SAM protein [bacterium]|nr:B12-binding domain-containing radical SAM protein [bacterium]
MRLLFFNPIPNLGLSLGAFRSFYAPMPPLWIGYLGAIAKRYTNDILAIDNSIERLDLQSVFSRIKEYSPDIFCISVLTQTASFAYKLARAVKENIGSFVIMGGPHASYFAQEIISRKIADAVVIGEGEGTFAEILENFDDIRRGNFRNIDGAVFFSGEEVKRRQRIRDLNSIPFPAWELLEKYFRYYKPPAPIKPGSVLTFLASRGCPYSCNFCMVQLGRKYTIRSPENICDEIEHFCDKYGTEHFLFCDPLFPPSKNKGLEILRYINKRGIQKITTWSIEARVDIIDYELAVALRESGCNLVALGIEGGDDLILKNVNKGIKTEQVIYAVRALKKAGIRTMGLYMLGTPGENEDLTIKTIKFARSLKTHGAKFAITVPYPGTELYEKYIKDKYSFSDDHWEFFSPYTDSPPYRMIWTSVSPKKLVKFQKMAYILSNISIRNIAIYLIERPSEVFGTLVHLLFGFFLKVLTKFRVSLRFFKHPNKFIVFKDYGAKNRYLRQDSI